VDIEPKQEICLIQQEEQGSGKPNRKPSPVIIKKYEKPNEPRGSGTARRLMMYRAVPDS
jgi:hypothetical protein